MKSEHKPKQQRINLCQKTQVMFVVPVVVKK
jgi:hypothetical protein